MTEEEWLNRRQVYPMIRLVVGQATERKLRLAACGCCRSYPPLEDDTILRTAVAAVEQYADAAIGPDELPLRIRTHADHPLAAALLRDRADDALGSVAYQLDHINPAGVLRCVFGNPFRPVAPAPGWLTSPVVSLARSMYDSRNFSPMPILADALQDAGCDNADVLDHCRGVGPHVRGCWVVDLILAKE